MHEIVYLDYNGDKSYDEIFKLANREYKDSDEYHSCLDSLKMINKYGIYNSRKEAYDSIEANDKGWYDNMCCKYYEYPQLVYSKKYTDIKVRLDEWRLKLDRLKHKIHYKGVKASFVSCPHCNSKINKDFLESNYCPICSYDMRPKTILDNINRYKEIVKGLEKDLDTELSHLQEKQRKKAKVMWLVKIEYHV